MLRLSVVPSCVPLPGLRHARLPCPVHLPEFAQTHAHCVSDAVQPSHPLSSPSVPAFTLPQHQGLCRESVLRIRWPKYWSFSISPSSEYSGLISFRTDWFDLLAVQGALKSPLQQHSLKASIRQCSTFFKVQLSHPYMTTRKTNLLYQTQKPLSRALRAAVRCIPSLIKLLLFLKYIHKIHILYSKFKFLIEYYKQAHCNPDPSCFSSFTICPSSIPPKRNACGSDYTLPSLWND